MKRLFIVAMFALCSCVVVNESYAGWFGPSNYDECILDSMENVDSDAAARLVAQSCRKKFPINKNSNHVQELQGNILEKIEGSATFLNEIVASIENKEWVPGGAEYLSGKLFNSNEGWYVTRLIIRVTDKDTNDYRDYDVAATTNDEVSAIPPFSNGKFYFQVYKVAKNWSWSIVGGSGYKK